MCVQISNQVHFSFYLKSAHVFDGLVHVHALDWFPLFWCLGFFAWPTSHSPSVPTNQTGGTLSNQIWEWGSSSNGGGGTKHPKSPPCQERYNIAQVHVNCHTHFHLQKFLHVSPVPCTIRCLSVSACWQCVLHCLFLIAGTYSSPPSSSVWIWQCDRATYQRFWWVCVEWEGESEKEGEKERGEREERDKEWF